MFYISVITQSAILIIICDYLQLCAIYSCQQSDRLSRLRLRMEEHFGEICAAIEIFLA